MNIKQGKLTLPIFAIGVLLITTFYPAAMASPGGHCDSKHMSREQMSPDKMHEHMKGRLGKLAERLEIKASQQAAWEEFARSVGMLAERTVKKPNDDADAATIARYHAEKAAEFARKLARIADATAKLQKALTEDQQKIFNQASHRFLHKDQGMDREGHEHESDQRGSPDGESHHDDHNSW